MRPSARTVIVQADDRLRGRQSGTILTEGNNVGERIRVPHQRNPRAWPTW